MTAIKQGLQETKERKGAEVKNLRDALRLLRGPKEVAEAAARNIIWSRLLAEDRGQWKICTARFDIMVSRKPRERVVHSVPTNIAMKLVEEGLVKRNPTSMVMAYAINQSGQDRLEEMDQQAEERARRRAKAKQRSRKKKA